MPRKMNTPSPPPPIAAAIVAVPTVVTVATRTPARIVGAARGSSTCHNSCRSVMPIATADSRTAGSTPRMPTKVLRRIGSSAYKTSATIAVLLPMPPISGIGIRNPKRARLGTVCNTFANPSTQPCRGGRRVSKMPSGIPIATAMAMDTSTSTKCSEVNSRISSKRPGLFTMPRMLKTSLTGQRAPPRGHVSQGSAVVEQVPDLPT